jgi:hypothetical protein
MEEHILNIFENEVLRKIFGPKRDNIPEDLPNEELRKLYIFLVVLREIKPGGCDMQYM